MKIKHLLLGMLAMAAAVACKQDEPVEEPKLDVDKTAVTLQATAGEATFAVTSTQNWVATADADWVSMDPASGAASQEAVTVKVTADDNTTTEARTATVTVKAGALTKTVAVTQAAGAGETPGPGDGELQASEWALVGTFGDGNNWNPESDLYLSVLDENYFVYYGMELASDAEFKFLKGGAWPPAGTEIGGNGLVEPNTIQPAGGSNIKVTEAGKYDIYLAADLTKFYIMSEGKLPAEAVEPAPVENSWGMMGCFVDNQWATDVPMAKEGEWIVAKGAQFTELTFKIRANSSWADATNIGVAPGSERGVVNGKVAVVTAEYAKANLGGDAADIKLNGEAGTYDVYFSFDKLEVYVMEQGFKPGEKEPQNPEPVEITYTVVGTLANQNWNNASSEGLMAVEGEYHVAKNVPFVTAKTLYGGAEQFEFKIVETGTWTGYGRVEEVTNAVNTEVAVKLGGENIMVVGPEGAYDVYFDKANGKVWVMQAGYKPGDEIPVPEPEPTQDGTEANPYLVADAAALQGMGALLVADATTYFKLTANIDLAGVEWTRIATSETVKDETDQDVTVVKAISLDGCGFTISNAKEALFSTLYGSVQNLILDGSQITVTRTAAGPLADNGRDVTIKNVTVKNLAISNLAESNNNGYTGGLLGRLYSGTVENVTVDGTVNGRERLGMLIGSMSGGTVKNCSVSGEVTGINYYIGGMVGLMTGGSVESCSSTANATTSSTAYGRIGGFIGQVEGGSISESYATGAVTSGGHYGGGFIGVLAKDTGVNVSKCYATGSVTLPATVNKSGGAGFIGAVENNGTFVISDCYTTASVTAYRWSGSFLGRMLNSCNVTITNCYTKANCTFTQPANCGALVGDVSTTATLTYSGCVAWNVNELTLFVRPGVETAPEGSYFGTEGTISAKAKEFNWDTAIWDLSADDPTLK